MYRFFLFLSFNCYTASFKICLIVCCLMETQDVQKTFRKVDSGNVCSLSCHFCTSQRKSYSLSPLILLKLMRKILKHHFWGGVLLEFSNGPPLYYRRGGVQNKIGWFRRGEGWSQNSRSFCGRQK